MSAKQNLIHVHVKNDSLETELNADYMMCF